MTLSHENARGRISSRDALASGTVCSTRVPMIACDIVIFFVPTLVTGPGRSLSLKLSDARVYESHTRAGLEIGESRGTRVCQREIERERERERGRERERRWTRVTTL